MGINTNTDVKKILVLGAGQLGMAVLKYLQPQIAKLDGKITVIVKHDSLDQYGAPILERHKELVANGAKLEALDIATISHEALASYFAKFNTVINCTGFVAGLGTQTRITLAVLEAKVARYFPWQFGVNYDVVGKGSGQPVFDEQFEVRTILRKQQVTDWVIISTGMFTSFLFEPAFDVVNLKGGYVNALGSWETKVTVTSPDDIGHLTTSILLESPRIANEVVFIAGDTISYGELADVVDEITGKHFERNVFNLECLQKELAHNPNDQMLRYRAAFALGDGMWWDKEDTYNFKMGIETQDVGQWLVEYTG